MHPSDATRSTELADAAEQPPVPMEGFADVADSSLDPDLLTLASGQRSSALMKRLKHYRSFIAYPEAASTDFCLQYQ